MTLIVPTVFLAITLTAGLYLYFDGTPKIKPRDNFVEISAGQTVTPEDLVITDKSYGIRIVSAVWENRTMNGIEIDPFGSSFTVTQGEGIIFVTLYAQHRYSGENVFETVVVICE